tara:strand:+ start:482 stop:688 length:207 start_codon:yes stop_codon:yes gene_type:complete
MNIGDLVKWSLSWIVMKRADQKHPNSLTDNVDYRKQVGVLVREWDLGWYVTWSDGERRRVHRDYLEAL